MAIGQFGASLDYSKAYAPNLVLPLLGRVFSRAGMDLVSRALQLYYLARSPDIPAWAKTTIFAALGYLLVTPDAVPDITPVLGFADDLAVLTSALASMSAYINPDIRAKVLLRLQDWFGDDAEIAQEKWDLRKT
jgi:uncharacterized membrane protein YkvA (DUF1232 family)